MGFKSESYTVEAIDMQKKVISKATYNTRTIAEIHGNMELKKAKIKLVKINGKIWKVKNQ